MSATSVRQQRSARRHRRGRNISTDPVEAALEAALRHVDDRTPGIRRQRRGTGFRYLDAEGKTVPDRATLERIRSLVIPPGWTDVWICPASNGHLQAVGRDSRGRKQYRYHPRWRAVRDETKFERMTSFARKLPRIRRRVAADLRRRGMSQRKVLASLVRLLERSLIRVGNEEYARTNGSFGLTTFKNHHARVVGERIVFSFRGKSGVRHKVEVLDRRLCGLIKRLQDLSGQDLFQFVDDTGTPRDITSADVNDYLREIAGAEFTAKDFRTWAGTLCAARYLSNFREWHSQARRKQQIVEAVHAVSEQLGNTVAVCRKCYIHPGVLNAFVQDQPGTLSTVRRCQSVRGLSREEMQLLGLLQRYCPGPT